jgi:hypothetical protein
LFRGIPDDLCNDTGRENESASPVERFADERAYAFIAALESDECACV